VQRFTYACVTLSVRPPPDPWQVPLALQSRHLSPLFALSPFDPERAIRETVGSSPASAEALETALGVRLWGVNAGAAAGRARRGVGSEPGASRLPTVRLSQDSRPPRS
jgi:hypothetical protein